MKSYSYDEATGLLPEVIPVLEALREAYIELRAIQASVAVQSRGASGDGHLLADAWSEESGENRVNELNRRIRQAATTLDRWNIEVKDPEKGLVDFLHEREGRNVYLCFFLGEATIGYWHDLDRGFAGRQPI